jgi:RNA polymerase subunit RPABC4/transcription elongation factor Spt4
MTVCIRCGAFVSEWENICKTCRGFDKEIFGFWHWEYLRRRYE